MVGYFEWSWFYWLKPTFVHASKPKQKQSPKQIFWFFSCLSFRRVTNVTISINISFVHSIHQTVAVYGLYALKVWRYFFFLYWYPGEVFSHLFCCFLDLLRVKDVRSLIDIFRMDVESLLSSCSIAQFTRITRMSQYHLIGHTPNNS